MRGYALGALLKGLDDSEWVDASPASGQFITFRFHYNPLKVCFGPVAHLGEHPPCKRKVAGSIPVWSTNNIWASSSSGRASALQAEGSEFDPRLVHH